MSAITVVEFSTTALSEHQFVEEMEDGPPFTVHGVALGAGDVTVGSSGIKKKWPAEELKRAADSLKGTSLVVDHNNDASGVVGRVTKSGYKTDTGVVYEAELYDEELSEKVKNDLLEVSIRGYHADVDALEEDDDTGAKIVEDIEFDNLSIVPKGASPSNTLEMGSHDELSVEELAAFTAELEDIEAGDWVQTDSIKGIAVTMPEDGDVDVDIYEQIDGTWRSVETVETYSVNSLEEWDVDEDDVGGAVEEDEDEGEGEGKDEDEMAMNMPSSPIPMPEDAQLLYPTKEKAMAAAEKMGMMGSHSHMLDGDTWYMPGKNHEEFVERMMEMGDMERLAETEMVLASYSENAYHGMDEDEDEKEMSMNMPNSPIPMPEDAQLLYPTKEKAMAAAERMGMMGSHSHMLDGDTWYMPGETHEAFIERMMEMGDMERLAETEMVLASYYENSYHGMDEEENRHNLIRPNMKFYSNMNDSLLRVVRVDGNRALMEVAGETDGSNWYETIPGIYQSLDVGTLEYHDPDGNMPLITEGLMLYSTTNNSVHEVVSVDGDMVTMSSVNSNSMWDKPKDEIIEDLADGDARVYHPMRDTVEMADASYKRGDWVSWNTRNSTEKGTVYGSYMEGDDLPDFRGDRGMSPEGDEVLYALRMYKERDGTWHPIEGGLIGHYEESVRPIDEPADVSDSSVELGRSNVDQYDVAAEQWVQWYPTDTTEAHGFSISVDDDSVEIEKWDQNSDGEWETDGDTVTKDMEEVEPWGNFPRKQEDFADAIDDGDPRKNPAQGPQRREGSDVNPEGSAASASAEQLDEDITFSDSIEKGLKNKVEEHNEEHGDEEGKRVTYRMLKAVYRRGAGAYSDSHREGMTRQQWSYARVNAFLYLVRNGNPENDNYTQDNDLLPEEHPKYSESEEAESADSLEKLYDDYPQAAVENAQMALDAKEDTGNPRDCGTRVGWIRAQQLADEEPISKDIISRMSSFNRHRKNSEMDEDEGRSDCGWMMWKAWGGDEGVDWAQEKLESIDEENASVESAMYSKAMDATEWKRGQMVHWQVNPAMMGKIVHVDRDRKIAMVEIMEEEDGELVSSGFTVSAGYSDIESMDMESMGITTSNVPTKSATPTHKPIDNPESMLDLFKKFMQEIDETESSLKEFAKWSVETEELYDIKRGESEERKNNSTADKKRSRELDDKWLDSEVEELALSDVEDDHKFNSRTDAMDFIEDMDMFSGVHKMGSFWVPGESHEEYMDNVAQSAGYGSGYGEDEMAVKDDHRHAMGVLEAFLDDSGSPDSTVSAFIEWSDDDTIVERSVDTFVEMEDDGSVESQVAAYMSWLNDTITETDDEPSQEQQDMREEMAPPEKFQFEGEDEAMEFIEGEDGLTGVHEMDGYWMPGDTHAEFNEWHESQKSENGQAPAYEGVMASDAEELEDYEMHTPNWSGTTEKSWNSPDLEDFDTDDLSEVDDHFFISSSGFPPENFTDLKLPVVEPNGELSLNALAAVKGGRGVTAVKGLESQMEEEIVDMVNSIANDEFDLDWGNGEEENTEADAHAISGTAGRPTPGENTVGGVRVLSGDDLQQGYKSGESDADSLTRYKVINMTENIEDKLSELSEPVAVEAEEVDELREKANRFEEMSENLEALRERTDILDEVDRSQVEELAESGDAVVVESGRYEELQAEADQVKGVYATSLAEEYPAFTAEELSEKFGIEELREKFEEEIGDVEEELTSSETAEPRSQDADEESLEKASETDDEAEELSDEVQQKQDEIRDKILGGS